MRRHHTRAPGGVVHALCLLVVAGCAGATRPLHPARLAEADGVPAGIAAEDVRVELHFGAEADLDLFVTDPMHEEIYFGNSSSRLGGIYDGDRDCGDPAPRVESVRFSPAPPGRYRVSVDFPIRCDLGVVEVPFWLIVEMDGLRWELERTVRFGRLERVVVEFEARGRARRSTS